jgi:hypothetical protein
MQFFQEFLMSSLQPLWSNDGVVIPFDETYELLNYLCYGENIMTTISIDLGKFLSIVQWFFTFNYI